MRHNRDEKRFDRTWSHMRSMLANMTSDLVMAGSIRTTTPRAKVLRRYAERMITLGKRGDLAARRRAMSFMRDKAAVTKLFDDVAPQYRERNGGYTRILKLGFRPGDNAAMSIIELVGSQGEAAGQPAVQKPAAKKKAAPKKTAAEKPAAKAKAAAKAPKTGEKPAAKKAAGTKTAAKKAKAE